MAIPEQNALISVYDKTGIDEFAAGLHELGWNIFASAGTASRLNATGIPATNVAELVGGEPILGHRVVTLSREVHAGLLATDNAEHIRELADKRIARLGLVCVDMYPLQQAIADEKSPEEILETTDIGGPTMLRAGAKGRRIVLSRAAFRQPVLKWLSSGKPHEETFIQALAGVAEADAATYTAASAKHILGSIATSELNLLGEEYDEVLQASSAEYGWLSRQIA